mgnify:CR=1 FL=1
MQSRGRKAGHVEEKLLASCLVRWTLHRVARLNADVLYVLRAMGHGDAIVIAEKSGDPGFGTIRKEETLSVPGLFHVRQIPLIIEGGAAPGGTTGKGASAQRLRRGHKNVEPPPLQIVVEDIEEISKLRCLFHHPIKGDRSPEGMP